MALAGSSGGRPRHLRQEAGDLLRGVVRGRLGGLADSVPDLENSL